MKKILCKILWHKFIADTDLTKYGVQYNMRCVHCGLTLGAGFKPRDVVDRLVTKYQHRKRLK